MLGDVDRLQVLAIDGTPTPVIAECLRRTISAVRHKAFRSGVRLIRPNKKRFSGISIDAMMANQTAVKVIDGTVAVASRSNPKDTRTLAPGQSAMAARTTNPEALP
jgi:hypothetical protein